VSGGSTPVSFTAADVCTVAVDADLVGVLPMDVGATGPVVVAVQEALEAAGFDVGPAGTDGRFGTRTDLAYRAWELATGRTVSGIVCQEDYDALTATGG
jgi:peptidoglycan hydrolase-like protein with peptidoglycan-binding domain